MSKSAASPTIDPVVLDEDIRSLSDVVDKHALRRPTQIAAVEMADRSDDLSPRFATNTLTYGDLATESRHIAMALAAHVHASAKPSDSPSERSSTEDRPSIAADPVVAILMQRGIDFYTVYIAAARARCPVMLLSTDHRDRAAEDRRWCEAIAITQPVAVVVDAIGELRWNEFPDPKPWMIRLDTLRNGYMEKDFDMQGTINGCAKVDRSSVSASDHLAFVFTGGTTRASRCVVITHSMALHELRRYREAVPLRDAGERVLQLSSCYWGAAVLGELDVALACGGTVVFSGTTSNTGSPYTSVEQVWRTVVDGGITVLGVVPALLALLPEHEAPKTALRVIIAWADALPAAVANRWLNIGSLHVVELLIASEYWLAFYANWSTSCSRPVYYPVRDVQWRVVAEANDDDLTNSTATADEVGELWLAGPMISPGYCISGSGHSGSFGQLPKVHCDGLEFLRTGDVVRRIDSGFQFVGRKDMMIKAAGKWVDLLAVQERLRAVCGVTEAIVITSPLLGPRPEAFVCVKSNQGLGAAAASMKALRAELPGGTSSSSIGLQILNSSPGLPRNPVTGKVDVRQLIALGSLASRGRQAAKASRRGAAESEQAIPVKVALLAVAVACRVALTSRPAVRLRRMRRLALRFMLAPFLWLSCILMSGVVPRILERPKRWQGLFCLALIAPMHDVALFALAAPGLVWTLQSGRAHAWAFVFWSTGPHAAMEVAIMHISAVSARLRSNQLFGHMLTAAQIRIVKLYRSALKALWRARGCPPRTWAWYKQPDEYLFGRKWLDTSGFDRHAYVASGCPKLEVSGALSFRPGDCLVFSALPSKFTILVSARYRPPCLRVKVERCSGDHVVGNVQTSRGLRTVEFRLGAFGSGCFPEVLVSRNSSRPASRAWRIVEIDGQLAPTFEDWLLNPAPAGAELLLKEQTGEEAWFSGSHGFLGGWHGSFVGVAWWSGQWRARSEQRASDSFQVVALRNRAGCANVFVDGRSCASPCDDGARTELPDATIQLGVNMSRHMDANGHCSVLELRIFEGHVDDDNICQISEQMAARAAECTQIGLETGEAHRHALTKVLDALSIGELDEASWESREETTYFRDKFCEWHRGRWTQVVDEIDLPSTVIEKNWSQTDVTNITEVVSSTGDLAQSSIDDPLECKLGAIALQVLGHPLDYRSPLASLDSLRLMALAEALRRELSVAIGIETLLRASQQGLDLPGFLALIADADPISKSGLSHEETSTAASADGASTCAVWTATALWEFPLNWTIQSPEPFDVLALRVALRRLCARHPLLRARRERPASLVEEVTKWTSAAAMTLQCLGHYSAQGSLVARFLVRGLSWALSRCWPRMIACAINDMQAPILFETEAADLESAERLAYYIKSADKSAPCHFSLIQCSSPRMDFLQIVASHAIADASTIVPLRKDLTSLYLEEVGGLAASLPPVPDSLQLLGERLNDALSVKTLCEIDGQVPYIGGWESATPSVWGYNRMVNIHPGAGAALRRASEALNVPLDVLLVVALSCSIARCDGSPMVQLTLTVPMRDGPGEVGVVGLLTDWRDLNIRTHPSETLLSVAFRTAELVRSRAWVRGTVNEMDSRMLMNLVAADNAASNGFLHRVDLGCACPPARGTRIYRHVSRPLEVQGWQISSASWQLCLRLDGERYPPSWASVFAESLQEIIQQYCCNPLAPVHRDLI